MKRKIFVFSLIGLFVFSGYLYKNRSTKTVTTEIRLERNENNQEKGNNTKKEIKKVEKQEEKQEEKVVNNKSTHSKTTHKSSSKVNDNKSSTQTKEISTSKPAEDKNTSSQVKSSESQNNQTVQETQQQEINLSELNQLILQEINTLRNTKIKMDTTLGSYASVRSQEISTLWSHTRPNGTRGVEMIDSTKYRGENLAKTSIASQLDTSTLAKRIVTNWKNSQSHYEIMKSDVYTNAGISTYTEKNGDIVTYYTVALFSN